MILYSAILSVKPLDKQSIDKHSYPRTKYTISHHPMAILCRVLRKTRTPRGSTRLVAAHIRMNSHFVLVSEHDSYVGTDGANNAIVAIVGLTIADEGVWSQLSLIFPVLAHFGFLKVQQILSIIMFTHKSCHSDLIT